MQRAVLSVPAVLLATLMAVTLGSTSPAQSASPGQDGRIVFVRANQIYAMSAIGGNMKKLTSSGKNYRPEWSPDGTRIAYIHEADGRHDVWVMNAWGRGKRPVTTTGDVTSAGAAWSPNGKVLAFGGSAHVEDYTVDSALLTISATRKGATAAVASGYDTGGYCGTGPEDPDPYFAVDRYLAWSPPMGSTSLIAVKTGDCYFDHAIGMYNPATGEFAQYMAVGGDCCGYAEWKDLFFGPTGQFGYTERDLGPYGDEPGPQLIVYPGFTSRAGDTGGAPSPSGRFMAFTRGASGTAYVMRSNVDGTDRRRLTVGYQPDWGRTS
jgi:hypothetical protein